MMEQCFYDDGDEIEERKPRKETKMREKERNEIVKELNCIYTVGYTMVRIKCRYQIFLDGRDECSLPGCLKSRPHLSCKG